MNLQYNHSKICTLGQIYIKSEVRQNHGLVSKIVFGCTMCQKVYTFETENPDRHVSLINTGAVWGIMSTGSTYGQLTELLSCMDIPTMPANMFYRMEKEMEEVNFFNIKIIILYNDMVFYVE